MVNRSNSDRLRGFCNGQTDSQTNICHSRVAFATENDPSIQYIKCKSFDILNQVVNLVGFYSLFSKKYFID